MNDKKEIREALLEGKTLINVRLFKITLTRPNIKDLHSELFENLFKHPQEWQIFNEI